MFCARSQHGESRHGKSHEERGLTNANAGSGLSGPPGLSRASNPKPDSVCLIALCLSPTLLTLTGGLSPHHLFLEKVNSELLDNRSPGHNKSVSIQKPL